MGRPPEHGGPLSAYAFPTAPALNRPEPVLFLRTATSRQMQEELPVLLVDNSNTRTKFALAVGGQLYPDGEVRCLPTRELTEDSVAGLLSGWRFGRVCISSVVEGSRAVLASPFAGKPLRWVNAALGGPMFDGYAGAATLGADRVANALAAAECGRLPVVAVDMGTAVTFDVVGRGPRFLGGVIAPGRQMTADALHAQTSLLPRVQAAGVSSRFIGRTTVEAMQAGVELSFEGMLRNTMREIEAELGERPFFIATGGDSRHAASRVRELDAVDEHLTLRGIALAAERPW